MSGIAVLEDDPRRVEAMKDALAADHPGLDAVFFDNAPDMIAWLSDHLPEVRLLSLDHDLGPGSSVGDGRDVVAFLAARSPACPVIVHTSNDLGRQPMLRELRKAGWAVDWVAPFSDLDWVPTAWLTLVGRSLGTI